MNISPLMVPAPMRMPRVPPISSRLRSSARSTSGAGDRFSAARKPNTDAPDTTKQSSVAGDVHPQSAPFEKPRMSGARIEGDEHGAEPVDRSGSVRVARLADRAQGHRDAHGGDGGIDPEQPLPAGRLDEEPADERPGRGADGRRRAPQRHRPQPVLAVGGQREEAQTARQDRRTRGALDAASQRSPPPRCSTSAIRTHEPMKRKRPPRNTLRRPNTSPRAPEVTMHAAPDQRVAGHRPLERAHRRPDVLADRGQEDRDRRGVGVDDERGDAGGHQDPLSHTRFAHPAEYVGARRPRHRPVWVMSETGRSGSLRPETCEERDGCG